MLRKLLLKWRERDKECFQFLDLSLPAKFKTTWLILKSCCVLEEGYNKWMIYFDDSKGFKEFLLSREKWKSVAMRSVRI